MGDSIPCACDLPDRPAGHIWQIKISPPYIKCGGVFYKEKAMI